MPFGGGGWYNWLGNVVVDMVQQLDAPWYKLLIATIAASRITIPKTNNFLFANI